MAFTYASIMRQMATALQDEGATRWMAPEMKTWIDLATIDIHTMKPNVKTALVQHQLVAGVVQTLDERYSTIIRFARNTSGGAITLLDNLETVDRWATDWDTLPGAQKIQFVYHDPATPRMFRVVPPASPTASIEMEVGIQPIFGVAPSGADALDPSKYTANIDLPDHYRTAVLHLALYRALMKDGDNAAGATQAQKHQADGFKIVADIAAGEAAMAAGARARTART